MTTAEDIYRAFLDGIKKEYAGVVAPEAFNRIINEAQLLWLGEKLPDIGGHSKRVDDLSLFYVRTDGKNEPIIDVPEDPGNWIVFFDYDLPDPFRFISAKFKVENNNSDKVVAESGLRWIQGTELRDFHNIEDPYQSSNEYRVLFREAGGALYVYTNNDLNATECILEYYRYPDTIVYDPVGGSINPETMKLQNKEIVDIAVRVYLERIKEQRYQSYINEEKLKTR